MVDTHGGDDRQPPKGHLVFGPGALGDGLYRVRASARTPEGREVENYGFVWVAGGGGIFSNEVAVRSGVYDPVSADNTRSFAVQVQVEPDDSMQGMHGNGGKS